MINAVILLYISLLYIFYQHENEQYLHLHPVDFLYIIVGLELILTLPCLIYYIGEREWKEGGGGGGGREGGRERSGGGGERERDL